MSVATSAVSWRSVAAGLPILIWARDSIGSVYRVKGSSMEPQLKDGDVVWVRKADRGGLVQVITHLISGSNIEPDEPSERLQRYESYHSVDGGPIENGSRLYSTPPLALNGHVVVFKSPEHLCEPTIKRVVGVGGQWIHIDESSNRVKAIPPYTLHVEGDNYLQSRDSRHYGPVSKNLLVGIAEYVVWPPSRCQRLRRGQTLGQNNERPKAFWP